MEQPIDGNPIIVEVEPISSPPPVHVSVSSRGELVFLVIFVAIIFLHLLVRIWERFHRRSFQIITLIGTFLFPLFFAIYFLFVRMLVLWTVYVVVILLVYLLARQRPMKATTPRRVYKYLLLLHKLTHVVSVVGGIWMAVDTLIPGLHYGPTVQSTYPLVAILVPTPDILLFYGLYFAVLTRDVTSIIIITTISHTTAPSTSTPTPSNPPDDFFVSLDREDQLCGICSCELIEEDSEEDLEGGGGGGLSNLKRRFEEQEKEKKKKKRRRGKEGEGEGEEEDVVEVEQSPNERIQMLECSHRFHEYCLKGWFILGKKDTCPRCHEKVDSKPILSSVFFASDSKGYLTMLDVVRFAVVWNPIFLVITISVARFFVE